MNHIARCIVQLVLLCMVFCVAGVFAAEQRQHHTEEAIEQLEEPLYNPFVERYVLDELKSLRQALNDHRVDVIEQVTDRQIQAVDKAVGYSYDTVTYFFYLLAGVSSLLVIIGWNSLREIKNKVHSEATEAVQNIVEKYEARLQSLETQLREKSAIIDANSEEIALTQDRHALWLRAAQESSPSHRMHIYDQILEIAPQDSEALIYKASAALELNQAQWAISLCQSVLGHDPENAQALCQLARAQVGIGHLDEAAQSFIKAVSLQESYRDELDSDPLLRPLRDYEPLVTLMAALPDNIEGTKIER